MMKSFFKTLYWNTATFFLFVPVLLHAQSGEAGSPSGRATEFQNPIGVDSIQEFFVKFLEILIQIAFPFLLLAVIYTGFLFVKAQGNSDELKTAKQAFLWTVIGALIVLGAVAIAELIEGTVNEIISP